MAKRSVLFIGIGSIGTRHLNNLRQICNEKHIDIEVHALRNDFKHRLREEVEAKIDVQFDSLQSEKALPFYDMVFLTNPTVLHAQMLKELKGKVGAWFIEKPIVSAEHVDINIEELLPPEQKVYVAAPMRWCAVMLALKDYLAQNKDAPPYSARVICSSYLPDWRRGVDYRTVYSAKKDMGGGVTTDLIHEWDYLVDLFGKPDELFNFKGKYSELEIDSDDISVYIAKYPQMLCEVHLDYFGREYRRTIELFCKTGTLMADFGSGILTLPTGEENYLEDVNKRYLREMSYFITYALYEEGTSKNTAKRAMEVLRLSLGDVN